MRITTKIMNNNMINNITAGKNKMYGLEQQYASGKKISKASEDPILAVRSLRLKTTVAELTQFADKNIPDATSWLELTDTALSNMSSIMTTMYSEAVYGSTDTLSATDREAIVENLKQSIDQLYDIGNAENGGKYIFTGYKTDSTLTFSNTTEDYSYDITQKFSGKDIVKTSVVTGSYDVDSYDPKNPDTSIYETKPAINTDVYKLTLGYDNLDEELSQDNFTFTTKAADGTAQTQTLADMGYTVSMKSVAESDVYNIGADDVVYIYDTGEILMGENVYTDLRLGGENSISITYGKSQFNAGEIKPEFYYDCTRTNQYNEVNTYTKQDEVIKYEINFGQKIQVNTEFNKIMQKDMERTLDAVQTSINAMKNLESKISQVDRMLTEVGISEEQKEALNALKETYTVEKGLREDQLNDSFQQLVASVKSAQTDLSYGISDLGSRLNRVYLVQERCEEQLSDYTELLAENDDVDIVETYVNLTSAETTYNAALQMATKVLSTSLLDYL